MTYFFTFNEYGGSSKLSPGQAIRILLPTQTGNAGKVLGTDGSTLAWVTGGGGGITSLNGLTASVQTFATGTTGTDFGISSSVSTHTFNIPTASAVNRGLLSTSDWTTFNNKQAALGFTPENVANKTTNINDAAGTYPDTPTVKSYVDSLASPQFSPTNGNTVAEIIDDFAYVTPLSGAYSSSHAMVHSGSNVFSLTNTVSTIANQLGVVEAVYNGSGDDLWQMIRACSLGQGELIIGCYMRRPSDSGAANQSNLRAGIRLGASDGTDGVFFKLNEATNSDRWQCITRASSVSTTTNTSVTTAKGSWVRLYIVINAAGTEAEFYINGTLVATHNTNMPASGTALSGIMNMEITVISSTITWRIDYFYIKQTFTAAR